MVEIKKLILIFYIFFFIISWIYRSQLSVCSEPANIPVYQLSIEHSLAEKVPKVPKSPNVVDTKSTILSAETTCDEQSVQLKRPTTLVLDCNRVDPIVASTSAFKTENKMRITHENSTEKPSTRQIPKTLFRSNSSSLHKRISTFVPAATTSAGNKFKLSSELDQIFVISNNRSNNANNTATNEDDSYDSIEVIDERRMKNMPKSDRARLYKSNTFICEEYYTNEQLACVMDTKETKETIIEEKREWIATTYGNAGQWPLHDMKFRLYIYSFYLSFLCVCPWTKHTGDLMPDIIYIC